MAVANRGYTLQIDLEAFGNLTKHAILWFATITTSLGVMGAEKNGIDAPADLGQFSPHAGMDCRQGA